MKKIGLVLLLLLIAAGGIIEYFRLKKQEVPPSNAIAAIPIDASFILEISKVYPFIKNITQTNLIWQDLIGTSSVSQLSHNLRFLDSLTYGYPAIHNVFEENPLFISGNTSGQDRLGFLFCCSVPAGIGQNTIVPFFKSIAAPGQLTETTYEGSIIYCLKKPGWNDFFCAFQNGLVVASLQLPLVEQSLRQLEKHISLMDYKYFTKTIGTSDGQAMANLFINFQEINTVADLFFSKSVRGELFSLNNFAEWMELDITLTPNEAIMNGFTDVDTVGSQFLQLFGGQPVRQPAMATVLPANTALMCSFELGDFRLYMKRYKQFLDGQRKLYKRNEWMEETEKKYGINMENYFYRWFGNEIALALTEPTDSSMQNNTYALINTSDAQEAASALDSLAAITAPPEANGQPFTQKYMNYTISRINAEGVLPNILGGTFEQLKQCYYMLDGNYVIFANTPQALEAFITLTRGGNTLAKDPYYRAFVKDHVADESGIYIYNNIALSPLLYEQKLNKEYSSNLKKYSSICRRFQAIAIQYTPIQGMFYTNIYLKYNPQYKKQAGALWQASLDTTLASAPNWVTDFRTMNKFVMAQDVSNCVYLISNTGQIQWKRKIDGHLLSKVQDVDALNNGKIQFLFNTSHSIDVLDRNGNNLQGFPLKLPSPAAAPIALFDYNSDKKYRILLCSDDKKIREYDIGGNQVKEWAKPETEEKVTCPVKHIVIGDKDYLVVADKAGNVYGYSRKGEIRIKFRHKLPRQLSNFYCTGFANLQNTYIWAADSSGLVYRLSFSDELTISNYLPAAYGHTAFGVTDLDGKGGTDLVFLTPEELYAYNVNKTQIFRFSESDTLAPELYTFTYPDGTTRLGALEPAHNKIYLWNNRGNVCNGFPLFGSRGFSITDMNNDGQYYLVTGSPDNLIYVYSLP